MKDNIIHKFLLKYPNLPFKEAFGKVYPKLKKYLGKKIFVRPNSEYPYYYQIVGKLSITINRSYGGPLIVSKGSTFISFDPKDIKEIKNENGNIVFVIDKKSTGVRPGQIW